MSQPLHVYFLPWLKIKEYLAINRVQFCPTSIKKIECKYNLDQEIKEKLINGLIKYVDIDGNPLKKFVICRSNMRILNDSDQTEEVLNAVNILSFLYTSSVFAAKIAHPTSAGGLPCSNIFDLKYYRISDDPAKIPTYVVGVNAFMGDMKFYQPPEAYCHDAISCDEKLIRIFSEQIYSPNVDNGMRRRILRGLDWCYFADFVTAHHSPLSKIVMLATALEVVLDIKSSSHKKIEILERLDDTVNTSFTNDIRQITGGEKKAIKNKAKIINSKAEFTKFAWWGYDFYKLRNDIVHGKAIGSKDLYYKNDVPHIYLASLVLLQYILAKMLPKTVFMNFSNLAEIRKFHPLVTVSLLNEAFRKIGWLN